MKQIPIIGIAAHGSDSGKTRLIVALLDEFAQKGLKVAVLKHGQHIALPTGKDSSFYMQAGAVAALVVAPDSWLMAALPEKEPDFDTALALLKQSCRADLLLVEGYKQGPQPKLLLTEEMLTGDMLLPHTLALVSDTPQTLQLPCFSSTDIVGIAYFIMHACGMGGV